MRLLATANLCMLIAMTGCDRVPHYQMVLAHADPTNNGAEKVLVLNQVTGEVYSCHELITLQAPRGLLQLPATCTRIGQAEGEGLQGLPEHGRPAEANR